MNEQAQGIQHPHDVEASSGKFGVPVLRTRQKERANSQMDETSSVTPYASRRSTPSRASIRPEPPSGPPEPKQRRDNDVLNHASFGLLPEEKNRFGSFGVSLLVNGLVGALILILTISTVHEAKVRQRQLALTYLSEPKPYVPPVPKVKLPPVPPLVKMEPPKIALPKPVTVPEPPKVEPLKVETKVPVIPAPAPKPVVQPPAPVLGAFRSSTPAPAAAVKVAPVARAAGLGDPVGVAPNPNANRAANVAAAGGFGAVATTAEGGSPHHGVVQGAGFGTGLGAGSPNGSPHGVVASAGFGTGTQAAGAPGGHGTVASAGFGANVAAAGTGQSVARVQQPVTTSIVVLSKPLPQYTPEAREMHVQGDVTLEVRFTATGSVEVLRVVNGLGHGLDEQARLAAERIRFKPATRDGKPVDQVSVIHVAFQLA